MRKEPLSTQYDKTMWNISIFPTNNFSQSSKTSAIIFCKLPNISIGAWVIEIIKRPTAILQLSSNTFIIVREDDVSGCFLHVSLEDDGTVEYLREISNCKECYKLSGDLFLISSHDKQEIYSCNRQKSYSEYVKMYLIDYAETDLIDVRTSLVSLSDTKVSNYSCRFKISGIVSAQFDMPGDSIPCLMGHLKIAIYHALTHCPPEVHSLRELSNIIRESSRSLYQAKSWIEDGGYFINGEKARGTHENSSDYATTIWEITKEDCLRKNQIAEDQPHLQTLSFIGKCMLQEGYQGYSSRNYFTIVNPNGICEIHRHRSASYVCIGIRQLKNNVFLAIFEDANRNRSKGNYQLVRFSTVNNDHYYTEFDLRSLECETADHTILTWDGQYHPLLEEGRVIPYDRIISVGDHGLTGTVAGEFFFKDPSGRKTKYARAYLHNPYGAYESNCVLFLYSCDDETIFPFAYNCYTGSFFAISQTAHKAHSQIRKIIKQNEYWEDWAQAEIAKI